MLEGTLAGRCELTIQTPGEPVLVTIDVEQFEQLLLNLAVNARDAMPDGGQLAIDLRPLDDGRVQMHVSDTGAGMSEEVAERAFEPFYTTKAAGDGSGLGLATVYGIVTQSGGEVRLTSTPGEGTRVEVELPPADGEAGEAATPGDPGARVAHGERILLVEDEDAVRSMAARILRRHGYEVIEAPGAEEALAAYRGLDRPPSLVLTDVAMPRMSGVELAARLGKSSPPVMFMSGYTDESVGDPDASAQRRLSAQALQRRGLAEACGRGAGGCLTDLRMANEAPRSRPSWARSTGASPPPTSSRFPATDEGLLRGDGAFEVIRVYYGTAVRARRPPRPPRALGGEPSPARRVPARSSRPRSPSFSRRAAAAIRRLLRIVLTRGGRRCC